MRPSCLAVSFLLLFIFVSSVQGIRLDKSFKSAGHPKLHEGSLVKTRINGGVMKGDDALIVCKEGQQYGSGKSRKLLTTTTSTTPKSTTTPKSKEIGDESKANSTPKIVRSGKEENMGDEKQEKVRAAGSPTSSSQQQEQVHDQYYADIMDIAEMDYSPAKRKPPIHN